MRTADYRSRGRLPALPIGRETIRHLIAGWSTRKESTQPSEGWLGKPLASPRRWRAAGRGPSPGRVRGSRGETTLLKELVVRALVAIQGIDARVRDEDGQTLAEYG